jgi:hypothetical protein
MKEWLRGGNGRRLLQILMLVILPVMIYLFSILTSQGLFSKVPMVLNIGVFIVFIISALYSFSYRSEAEDKLTDDFPMDYLPINQGYAFTIQILFITILLYVITAFSFIIGAWVLNAILIDGKRMYPFLKTISLIKPLFAGLIYTILFGTVFGGFLGSIAKKIADNFSGGLKRFIMLLSYVITFFVFKKYFADSYSVLNNEGFLFNSYVYSITGLSSIFVNLFFGEFNFLQFVASTGLLAAVFIAYIGVNGRKWKFIRDFEIYTDLKDQRVKFLSPMWNLVLRRIFTTPIVVLVIVYTILILFVAIMPKWIAVYAVIGILSYVYLFMFLDRIFPSKDENYRHILDTIPVRHDKINGIVLGVYYVFFLLPFFAANYVMTSNAFTMQNFMLEPKTLSQFIALYFLPFTLSAVIPSILMTNPYFLSENNKGKKPSRGFAIIVLVLSYVFLSNLALFMNMYFFNPVFQEFVNNMFWKKGYYVWKIFVYLITFFALDIHLHSIFSFFRSFKKEV